MLNQCNYVVMDEADRMIDLGFEPQVHNGSPPRSCLQYGCKSCRSLPQAAVVTCMSYVTDHAIHTAPILRCAWRCLPLISVAWSHRIVLLVQKKHMSSL